MLWAVVLFATFALLNFIALLPALDEWRARRDAQPLKVVREYDGDVRFFAYRFAGFVDRNFGVLLLRCRQDNGVRNGTLPDGQPFHIVSADGHPVMQDAERSGRLVKRMLLGCGQLVLENDLRFEREIYADGPIHGGGGNVYCALLSTGDIVLGEKSAVLRWSHAEGAFIGGEQGMFFGRVSAERTMVIGPQSNFTRLHAPVIEFGSGAERPARGVALSELLPKDLPHVHDTRGGRTLVKGDIVIPPRTRIEGDLVATGRVRIGRGAWVAGNVKGRKGVYVEAGAWVDGALISGKSLHAEDSCWIKGPIIAERHVTVGRNCRLGSPETPTTVSAEAILVACGVTAYGSVWARATGRVGDG
jgi:cytoskeletal protein CcmA (bactofilin family)